MTCVWSGGCNVRNEAMCLNTRPPRTTHGQPNQRHDIPQTLFTSLDDVARLSTVSVGATETLVALHMSKWYWAETYYGE